MWLGESILSLIKAANRIVLSLYKAIKSSCAAGRLGECGGSVNVEDRSHYWPPPHMHVTETTFMTRFSTNKTIYVNFRQSRRRDTAMNRLNSPTFGWSWSALEAMLSLILPERSPPYVLYVLMRMNSKYLVCPVDQKPQPRRIEAYTKFLLVSQKCSAICIS